LMEKMFCIRLKELRNEKELTQTDVAKVMNVNHSTVCYWERGKSSPDIYELIRLADFFGVTTDYLLGRTDFY